MTGASAAPSAASSRATQPIIGVAGVGVTGGLVARHLLAAGQRVAAVDQDGNAVRRVRGAVALEHLGDLGSCDVAVLCHPAPHAALAAELLADGVDVVSMGADLADVKALLALHPAAERKGRTLVIGAGMAPGLSGLLARSLAGQLHELDELHVATHGTAGPACARQHHHALGHTALGWHDGEWIEPAGGSGRDLVWFPEPMGAHDCYRAALPDPLLLQAVFPGVLRVSARVSATRRDRMTARLPMLTPPHADGDLGAVRVEARGAGPGGERITLISGASGPTAELAAAVCAATALRLLTVGAPPGAYPLGAGELDALDVLHHATGLGVRVQEFTGVARATHW